MQLSLRGPVYFIEHSEEADAMYTAIHHATAWSSSLATAFLAPRALVNVEHAASAQYATPVLTNIEVDSYYDDSFILFFFTVTQIELRGDISPGGKQGTLPTIVITAPSDSFGAAPVSKISSTTHTCHCC